MEYERVGSRWSHTEALYVVQNGTSEVELRFSDLQRDWDDDFIDEAAEFVQDDLNL